MSNYRNPFRVPDPTNLDATANKMFMELMDSGVRCYHVWNRYYFLLDDESRIRRYDLEFYLTRKGLMLEWTAKCRNEICRKVCEIVRRAAVPYPRMPIIPDDFELSRDPKRPTLRDLDYFVGQDQIDQRLDRQMRERAQSVSLQNPDPSASNSVQEGV